MEIATKYGGVALAAQSLGYMLKNMETYDEWESVRDSYIWNLSTLEGPSSGNNEVLQSLLLSYSHMSDCLKLCFSYCAVFPKGHNIVMCDLIHQWIALGFTKPSRVFDSMQLCKKYVTQLLGMSFLQHSKAPPSGELQGKDLFTMHDLVHDLATEVLADKVNKKGNAVGSSCHYALITDCSKPLQLSRSSPENMKALFFLDCDKIELHDGAFSPAMCLHVLDLSECSIRKLPDSLGQLKKLRYLRAPRVGDGMIPGCITELSELNYLNLSGSCNISSLPESIGDMKQLMHLDLSGCVEIRELPLSFAKLKQLVHLDLSLSGMSVLAEALGGCTKLQYLNLSGCHRIREPPKSFTGLKQLVHLDLSLCSMTVVEAFDGCLPMSFAELKKLVHLDLSLSGMSVLAEALGGCTKLQYLNLSGCHKIRELPKSFAELKQLVHLDLSQCCMSISKELVGFTKLQYLDLSADEHIRAPRVGLLGTINNLTKLRYLNLSPRMLFNDHEIDSISTISNLEHLDLSHSYRLPRLPESIVNLRNLHTLDLSGCSDLKKLPDSMIKMVSLKVLNVTGCSSLDESPLPLLNCALLPHFVVQASSDKCSSNINLLQLTNPDVLTIDRLENVMSVQEAQSIKLIEKKTIELLRFQWTVAAERFVDDKEALEQLVPPSSVQKLYISGYSSVSVPDWLMGIRQYLPNLIQIDLFKFPKCNNLPPLGQLPNLQELGLYYMESLEEWNMEYIGGQEGANKLIFPKLEKLIIEQCPKLKLNGNTRKLTRLQELSLSGCKSMTSLPEWLGELTSLEKIEIEECEGIRALPDSIKQLGKLEFLRICGCPTLLKWCESEENKRKLTHITTVFPRSLLPLRTVVMNMPGFTEKALRVAVSHLENTCQASAYMNMHEEHQVLWWCGEMGVQGSAGAAFVVHYAEGADAHWQLESNQWDLKDRNLQVQGNAGGGPATCWAMVCTGRLAPANENVRSIKPPRPNEAFGGRSLKICRSAVIRVLIRRRFCESASDSSPL